MPRSEDDYRTLLISEINARLPRPYRAYNSKHVKITPEDPRHEILMRTKAEFDVVIADSTFVSETEINPDRVELAIETKSPRNKMSGIKQAEDAFTAFAGLRITYATKFGKYMYRRERNFPEKIIEIKGRTILERCVKMAEIIRDDVKAIIDSRKVTRAPLSEIDIIETLKDCMHRIQSQMTELPDETEAELTARTLIMWKKYNQSDVDVSTLDYNVKRAASYIIVDQLLFYHLLQKKTKKYRLPPLEPINGGNDDPNLFRVKYIDRAIDETGDYRPIFDFDMLGLLPRSRSVVAAINDVIEKITALDLGDINTDFIGKIFHNMIPLEIRKPLAAYYTGSAPANLLAHLSIEKETDKVCDLACGSGTLLVESYHVLREKYKEKYPDMSDEEIHKEILENQIYGNDITLFASHLAAMNLASQYLDGEITRINITSTNGLEIMPRKSYRNLRGLMSDVNVETVDMGKGTGMIEYPYVDVVIMNPPFSRHADMTDDVFASIDNAIHNWFQKEEDIKKYIDKKMGLHGYFLIHADHIVKRGGRISVILPTTTFTTQYGRKLLAFLKDNRYSIEYVIEMRTDVPVFSEDANFKEYMVIFRKGMLRDDSTTTLVSILKDFDLNDVNDILSELKSDKKTIIESKTISTLSLYNSSKWTQLFSSDSGSFMFTDSHKLELYKDNTSEFEILGGFNGSYAKYLMLPNSEWSIERINEKTFRLNHTILPDGDENKYCKIDSEYLVPAIRKSGDANSFISSPNSYVLDLPYRIPRELLEFQRKYLYWAEKSMEMYFDEHRKKGHKRLDIIKKPRFKKDKSGEIVVTMTPWYSNAHKSGCKTKISHLFHLEKYRIPTRRSVAFYSNETATVNHSMYYIKCKDYTLYASYTASSVYLYFLFNHHQLISKSYYRVLIKDFENVKFPKYAEFVDEHGELTEEAKDLIKKWEDLAKLPDEEVPFIPQQIGYDLDNDEEIEPLPQRVALDNAWLRALGVPEDKIDEERKKLYEWLIDYLKRY